MRVFGALLNKSMEGIKLAMGGIFVARRQQRNWERYNENLVQRGEILLRLDVLHNWQQEVARMNEGKRGRPFAYPETMMLLYGMIRAAFHLPYRQLEGFARGLRKLTHLPAPDYTTLSLRLPELRLGPGPRLNPNEPVVLAVDSSGIKLTNRGQWRKQERRGWIKIHVAVDVKTKQVLSVQFSPGHVHDTRYFYVMVKEAQARAPIRKVLADSAYDSKKNFAFLRRNQIQAGINLKGNSTLAWHYLYGRIPRGARADAIRKWRVDPEKWRTEMGYGQRQIAESFFSSFKRMFGEAVQNRNWLRILQELRLKVWLYNLWVHPEPAAAVA